MNMTSVTCTTPAQIDAPISSVCSEQQLDLQRFQSEADFINIMGTVNGVTAGATNTKLLDASVFSSVLFVDSPIFSQPSSGVLNYTNLNHTTPKQTTIAPGDINAEIYVSMVDQLMPQGTQSPTDYANLLPVQTQVTEIQSGGESPCYTDLSPAQTYHTQLTNTAEPIQDLSGETINITEVSQFLSDTYSIGQTSEASQTLSETFSIQHYSEATVTPASSPGYATHDHQVPVSDVESPCTEWSSDYNPLFQAATPEAGTPGSTSAYTSDGGLSDATLTPSPAPNSPLPEPRSRRQNKAGGPVRGSGRTRRNSSGPAAAARSVSRKRKPRERKTKLYERNEPYDDPLKEKKRQDAINSKINRDKKKDLMGDLRAKVEEAVRERDDLRKELDLLREREARLRNQFSNLQQILGPSYPSPDSAT